MKHRGEIVQKAITLSKVPVSEIARQIGYSRANIYNFYERPDLNMDIVLAIGKAIHYDFRQDLPEISIYTDQVQEPAEVYETATLAECLKEKTQWKNKYFEVLEKYNTLLEGKINQ